MLYEVITPGVIRALVNDPLGIGYSNQIYAYGLGDVPPSGTLILPGISGSFILLLLGMYPVMIDAISEMHWQLLLMFMLGCARNNFV